MTRFIIPIIIFLPVCFGVSCNQESNNNQTISSFDKKSVVDSPNYQQGKLIFRKFCNTCHIAPERNLTDQQMFVNLFERLPSPPEQYFIKYVRDSKSLRDSADKYALSLRELWGTGYNHHFKDSLSQQNFTDLICYIKKAAKLKYK
jgi:hypothetical protein